MELVGRAAVFYCDPAHAGETGCGFFGLYKPEITSYIRRCPSCGQTGPYKRLPEIAVITLEPDSSIDINITGKEGP